MSTPPLKHVVEAALFAAGRPLTLDDLLALFASGDLQPERAELRSALGELAAEWEGRGIELVEVASGHRFQVRKELGVWMAPLWAERPPRYSRALLETLALVAYRQPLTRAEIEEVRGVSVSSSIIKTLMERDWIRVLGHREVPGRPALYGTTGEFLDAFGLRKLEDLPPLSELKDLDQVHEDLFSGLATTGGGDAGAGGDGLPGVGGASGEAEAGAEDPETGDAPADGAPVAQPAAEVSEEPGDAPGDAPGETPAGGRTPDAAGDAPGAEASAGDVAPPAGERGAEERHHEPPEVDEPEATEPGRNEAGVDAPEAHESGAHEPGADEPGATEPEADAPQAHEQSVDEPEPDEPGGDTTPSTDETGGPAPVDEDGQQGRDGPPR